MAHQRNTSRQFRNQPQNRSSLGPDALLSPTTETFTPRQKSDPTSSKAHESPPESPQKSPHFAQTTPLVAAGEWSETSSSNGDRSAHKRQSQSISLSIAERLNDSDPPMPPNGSLMTPPAERANPLQKLPAVTPTWSNLPNKGQLAILAASRFVDFFQMAALQTFMVHQLKSFDPELSDVVISHQAGVLQGAFTAAQIVTSILWGRAADQPSLGRKTVLQIGLIGTGFGCIGVGFSKTYGQAVFWRLMSGAINGTVGSARTMVAEVTPKPWHPRAFLLLPAAFNVANVAGPLLAGALVDPVVNLPGMFGPGGTFGGEVGVEWMQSHPYAAANLMSTLLLFAEAALVHFFLRETLQGRQSTDLQKLDPVKLIRDFYGNVLAIKDGGLRAFQETQRESLLSGRERSSVEMDRLSSSGQKDTLRQGQRLAFRRIWTSNVLWTLLSIAIFDFHMGAFANLWILFLATPREFVASADQPDTSIRARSAFKFASGLAFPPPTIGLAMAIIGFIGVALQFLLYPWANGKFGLMRCFRMSLFLFPLAYYLAPYLALLPSQSASPEPASGPTIWLGISFVLFLQVAARTFALPASIILLNNSSPHPSVLATIHGIGNACSATFRTIGPMLAGYWYGMWTERGIVGMAWWIVATIAALGCVASFKVRNGSGHEIFLPGEEGDLKEAEAGLGRSGDGR
ncbi:Putative major facilitator superfamily, MFS transporter superfamily [Septoria linicola]|uniref:Major facilitator superfamily, MFS transporter superfamily n=1 Tax=Septoria linicola TaxID=215465 RepID=A0A9Q9ARV1_9PEZI|nr:putative major facilitator superfamily, MFS transporter superfamily [Septoria linicola]USW53960.1 Putative major facilitator superfamily, MFS transporter superfamily [Septoria linicola]